MADKSWMKPGVECWVWGFDPPRRATLVKPDGDDCWVFRYEGCGWLAGSAVDYIYRTELEAQRAWMDDEIRDLQILQARMDRTREEISKQEATIAQARARIAELESAPGAAGQQTGKDGDE